MDELEELASQAYRHYSAARPLLLELTVVSLGRPAAPAVFSADSVETASGLRSIAQAELLLLRKPF